jgi:cAMP-dependent protein kinase regulator
MTRVDVEKGDEFAQRGEWWNATLQYQHAVKAEPRDLAARQKLAESLARVGRTAQAVREYQHVAGACAAQGQHVKAMALSKIIQDLDPTQTALPHALAGLIAGRDDGTVAPVRLPPALTAAVPDASQPAPDTGLAVAGVVKPWSDDLATPPHGTPAPLVGPAEGDVEIVVEVGPELDLDPATLARIPLFSSLSQDAFRAILDRLQLHAVKVGDVIMREGEEAQSLFVIVQGAVEVVRVEEEERVVLATLGEGAIFGEMALVAHSPRLASVVVSREGLVLELSRDVVEEILALHPSVSAVLERFYRERLQANLLRCNPLFRPLSPGEREFLSRQFKSVAAEAGITFIRQDQQGDGLYIILRGRCEAFSRTGDGQTIRYPELREGDAFGEISLVTGSPATATVRAVASCVVLQLPREAYDSLVRTRPDVGQAVMALAAQRLDRSSRILDRAMDLDLVG